MQRALQGCFRDFIRYLDASTIRLGEQVSEEATLQWVKELSA